MRERLISIVKREQQLIQSSFGRVLFIKVY